MAQFLDLTGLSRFKNKNDGIYAKKDGYYQNLGAGVADQLSSTVGIEDKTPYNSRTSGGSVDIGDREELNAVVGVSVPWNQLNARKDGDTLLGVTVTLNSDGSYTFTGTATAVRAFQIVETSECPPVGHKVLFLFESTGDIVTAQTNGSVLNYSYIHVAVANDYYRLRVGNGATVNETVKASVFDLTQMFGSTIADYIYALEQSNSGAGVAYFKKLFPKSLYQYNSGALLSTRTNLHRMVGFNAYNPTTGTAKLVGGNQYQITGAYTALSLDGTTITPDANGKFTPSANGTLTVTGGNNTTTCVHLVWDGEKDGEFEPFEAHEYALDDITLRGILKLDASNNLYADGDRYLSDGTVIRKRRQIVANGSTFGASQVGQSGTTYYSVMDQFSSDVIGVDSSTIDTHIITDKGYRDYPAVGVGNIYLTSNGSKIVICLLDQTLTTVAAVNSYLASNPITIEYELATPTTETADPYQQTQIVDDFGTEEFVDAAVEANERDVAIPVGHETFYQNNLKAKLEMAPNSPDGDGVYVVQQTNGENEYIPLVIPTELPTAPTDDGTYVLKITVSGGTVTKAWVEEV